MSLIRFIASGLIIGMVFNASVATLLAAPIEGTSLLAATTAKKVVKKKVVKKKVVKEKKKKVVKKKVIKKAPVNNTAGTPNGPIATDGQVFFQTPATTTINGVTLNAAQKKELADTYGMDAAPGNFWYDQRSGAYGRVGEGMLTFINPGHSLGTMSSDASNGSTGIIINGRNIPPDEVLFYVAILGSVVPGQYWLDGSTGDFGIEGSDVTLGNIIAAIQQKSSQAAINDFPGGGGDFYRSGSTDATIGSQGGCSYVSFGDGSGYAGSGC